MTKPVYRNRSGMTLIEILITVSIIGLLAAFIIPAYNLAIRHRKNALVASQLRQAITAFGLYRMEVGGVPVARASGVIPPEMTEYFSSLGITSWWTNATEVGGGWTWSGGANAGVVLRPTVSNQQLTDLDKLIDDGNLATGNFRQSGLFCRYSLLGE